MELHWKTPLLVLISLLFFDSVSLSKQNELQQLLRLKNALTEKSNASVFKTWTQHNSVCQFTGIRCNSDGFVSEINLSSKQLSGTLPFDAICSLQYLEKIYLGSNFLQGRITDDLKNCRLLQYLDLGFNSFIGKVPDLSNLSELKYLNLNASGVSGQFPWKSLESLTNLTLLSIGDNPFDPSSLPSEIIKLEKLYWLYLKNCSINGKIPEGIGNLTLLENLEIADNNLSGEIPTSIGKLQKLWQLELYNNSLSGKLPNGFGNLTNLLNFDASDNMLEGDLSELRFLKNLKSLQLFENQLVGQIPKEFGEFKDLIELSLYRNKLTGELPQKLGSWSNLEYIDVSENFLTGSIPPDMCKNKKMTDLLVLQNKFIGGLPESYASCDSLTRIRVNNNSFSGVVPNGIWSLPNLTIIDVSMNQFEGPVTSDIGKAKSLAQLLLKNNQFSGELPDEISEASSLISFQLSSNRFSGQIPESIGKLKKLSDLSLDRNQFSGPIPESLGSCVSISQINLADNLFSGKIPASLGSLRNLNSLILSDNQLSGEIPSTFSSLKLSVFNLSHNNLIGRIPNSLSIEAFHDSFIANPSLCSQNMETVKPCFSKSSHSSRTPKLMYCLIAGTLVVLVSLSCFFLLKLNRTNLDKPLKNNSWKMKSYHMLRFTENEIINAVKSENLIGKGGSGNVYRAVIGDGKEVAVKHIWKGADSGDSRSSQSSAAAMLKKSKFQSTDYDAEVATLSSVRHVNVVKLYCSITSEDSNLLVYEYLPNGSLWDRLHTCDKVEMRWEVRYEIALGAAKGLEYLHHGCNRPVIHRDVKSSNILLNENWKPKIADFGLAKIVQPGRDCTHFIAGTLGYIAPGK